MNTNQMIRLIPSTEKMRRENANNNDCVTVVRESYENLIAYFSRSKHGTLVVVNSNLSIHDQAKAIKILVHGIGNCKITHMGMIDENWKYKCNGICCK